MKLRFYSQCNLECAKIVSGNRWRGVGGRGGGLCAGRPATATAVGARGVGES